MSAVGEALPVRVEVGPARVGTVVGVSAIGVDPPTTSVVMGDGCRVGEVVRDGRAAGVRIGVPMLGGVAAANGAQPSNTIRGMTQTMCVKME